MTFAEFKQCVRREAGLDLEAIDVVLVQPLKDLHAWWERQAAVTKAYINLFTTGLGAAALTAFLAKVLRTTAAALATLLAEALGAVIVGLAIGTVFDVLGRCGIQAVETA